MFSLHNKRAAVLSVFHTTTVRFREPNLDYYNTCVLNCQAFFVIFSNFFFIVFFFSVKVIDTLYLVVIKTQGGFIRPAMKLKALITFRGKP